MTVRLAVVTSGFPRISETFALNELVALHARGMLAGVFATKDGDWSAVQPQVRELRSLVHRLPAGDIDMQAAGLVRALNGERVDAVHAYFAHEPAAVAARAAAELGVPYGFGTHAVDIRRIPLPVLIGRARGARAVLTCNRETADELRRAGVEPALLPHGVDLSRFTPNGTSPAPAGQLRVLAVGRFVEKKGFAVLLQAADRLDRVSIRLLGSGPLEGKLRNQSAPLGGRIVFAGVRTHADLPREYSQADVVVVPSVVDSTGDRDGLPNVLLEAMASGRAVVASDVAAVSTAVQHGRTGLLVPPNDPQALAAALRRLRDDPALRARLGAAARVHAVTHYDLARCTDRLCRRLEVSYG